YLSEVVANIPDSNPEKKRLLDLVDENCSHTELLLDNLEKKKIPEEEQIPALHLLNLERINKPVTQDLVISLIALNGGFKNERVESVKTRIAQLDQVVKQLIATDPQDRISAAEAARQLHTE
ncbi:MAG: hypothetical protein KDK44_03990, partial [Chlamydiia bacterium]|nr:hypothetical protein [Chlamydiia bacterium]